MYLEDLTPGDIFVDGLGRTGTLLALTAGSALVQYAGGSQVSFEHEDLDGKSRKSFTRPNKPITISLRTEVVAF